MVLRVASSGIQSLLLQNNRRANQFVRQSIERLRLTPFLTHKEHIRGFVYDVDTGRLHEVEG